MFLQRNTIVLGASWMRLKEELKISTEADFQRLVYMWNLYSPTSVRDLRVVALAIRSSYIQLE